MFLFSGYVGRQHHVLVQLCSCGKETNLHVLAKLKLWPSTPVKPRLAFHIDLMELFRTLVFNCHVAVTTFWEALQKQDNYVHCPQDVRIDTHSISK